LAWAKLQPAATLIRRQHICLLNDGFAVSCGVSLAYEMSIIVKSFTFLSSCGTVASYCSVTRKANTELVDETSRGVEPATRELNAVCVTNGS